VHERAYAETFTSSDKAGVIYKLQGEYLGVIEAWGGNWGAQVIAVSENKIHIHLLEGGLTGQGYKGTSPSKKFETTIVAEKEKAVTTSDAISIEVKPSELQIFDATGKQLGALTKVLRESKTLGALPPVNAIVLFDVNRANDFKGSKIGENGELGVGGTSKELLGDHHMHLEFRTPFQPSDTGQARGNSGVYIQGRYEVQILDSFGLAGKDNECGGVYQIAKPALNMCYPPLSWQTYDIDFQAARYDDAGKKVKNARLSVRHNGVTIHDNLELPGVTPGKDSESNRLGPVYLQDHGNPVLFRNIWVKKIAE